MLHLKGGGKLRILWSGAPALCKALGIRRRGSHRDEADGPCPRGAYSLVTHTAGRGAAQRSSPFSGGGVFQAKGVLILKSFI